MTDKSSSIIPILQNLSDCQLCREQLPLSPRPIFQLHPKAKILIIGQAPGIKAHENNIAFKDKSGERLRHWLGVSEKQFYDEHKIAMMPMSFCYPGKGATGDLPPIKMCAPQWHQAILNSMPAIELTILIGSYAQNYYLPESRSISLTQRVKNWKTFWPDFLPLPHPSPRNNIWLSKNPWFEKEVVHKLQQCVSQFF